MKTDKIIATEDIYNVLELTQEVYSYFEDNQSKKIFDIISNFRFSKDNERWNDILKYSCDSVSEFNEKYSEYKKYYITPDFSKCLPVEVFSKSKIVIYGANILGRLVAGELKNTNSVIFCDMYNDILEEIDSIPVISEKTMIEQYLDSVYFIGTFSHLDKMIGLLLDSGVEKQNIYIPNHFADMQVVYFDMFKMNQQEIFVDIGAFEGETSLNFVKCCKNLYKKIYLIEPEKYHYAEAENNMIKNKIKNVECIRAGLWKSPGTLSLEYNNQSSQISEDGEEIIEVNTLNYFTKGQPVTFLKFAMRNVLLDFIEAAEECIVEYKPKIAISYIVDIENLILTMKYLKTLVPEYKFFLRHYSTSVYKTVLYVALQEDFV